VEIKGYRGEDAVVKKTTMDTYWIPGVNHLGTYGRWAFVELRDIYEMETDFAAKISSEVDRMISEAVSSTSAKAG
jgi:type III restriction enzyme